MVKTACYTCSMVVIPTVRSAAADYAAEKSTDGGLTLGPVEIAVFSFPGSQFNGQVAPALRELIESETIHVLDLAFIIKAENGDVAWFEIEDAAMHAPEFSGFHDDPIDLLNTEDIELLAEEVAPGSSAAVLVFEHTWAKKLAGAVEGSGGFVVAREYIPAPIVEAAVAAAQNS
jgi:hypothetical protein